MLDVLSFLFLPSLDWETSIYEVLILQEVR